MRLLADENCDRMVVAMLRDAGHDVAYIAEMARGESDIDLMRRARLENRAILTDDRDFGLLAEREREPPPAIILVRLDPLGRAARARRIAEILNALTGSLRDELVVVEPAHIRRRPFQR